MAKRTEYSRLTGIFRKLDNDIVKREKALKPKKPEKDLGKTETGEKT